MPGTTEYVREWKRRNRKRVHGYYITYREKYPERFPESPTGPMLTAEERRGIRNKRSKEWQIKNPEKVAAASRRWREKNKERHKATTTAWKKANADRVRTNKRDWIAEHPGSNNERAKRWVANNPEKAAESGRKRAAAWAARNPHKVAIYKSRSHVKRQATIESVGTFTLEEWNVVLDRQGHRCAVCGIPERESIYRYPRKGFHLKGKLTIDHVIPLSKGGVGTIDNIAALCLPCNIRKRNKIEEKAA